MSSGHIIVHASVIAKAEHFDKVKEALVKIREYALNQEEGTLVYRTSISKDNGRKIEIFEEYSGKEAFDAHLKGEPFQELSKHAKEWLEVPPVISQSIEF